MDDRGREDDTEPADTASGRAILLCAPSESLTRHDACLDLLVPTDGDAVDVLCVSLSGDPVDHLEAIRSQGVDVARTALASVGADRGVDEDLDRSFSVESLETVDQLSDLGMYVREVLEDWAASDAPSVVCFDSVDDLLERADLDLVFEFLLVFVEGIRPWDPTAHFHFDPDEHDGTTRRTLAHLFDDVVDVDGDAPVG